MVVVAAADVVSAITGMEGRLMGRVQEVMDRLAALSQTQLELTKDVRRLIADGDTTAALAAVDALIAQAEAIDAEVEAASPELTSP